MTNRREFILTGVATAGAVAMQRPLQAVAGQPSADLYTVVHDDRFAASRVFAQTARRLGLRTSLVRGDVTALWYDDLYHRWKQGPAAIAGMTSASTFFCLETLAMDAGLRRVLHVEHRTTDTGVEHRMDGQEDLVRQAALEDCGSFWGGRMAQLVGRCPASRAGRTQATATSATPTAQNQTLITWVMAALERA